MIRTLFALGFSALGLLAVACTTSSSSSEDPGSSSGATTPQPDAADAGPEPEPDAEPPPPTEDACGAIRKSKCKPANEGSVVRGIVKFDPAHFAGKTTKPKLWVFMHHQYILTAGEEKLGGHPHAFNSFPVDDTSTGEVHFTLDLCELGTAMWSEENCGFNLVAMLDENGNNDAFKLGSTALVPDKGELVGMIPLEISCHKPSPCVTIDAKCTDGDACTTYSALKKCACAAEKCPSDDAICKLPQ